jgi:hypothetical protein
MRRWFAGDPGRLWAVIFGLYLVGRVVIVIGGHVYTSYDAITYAARPGHPDNGLVSLTGQSPRPWGVPLFYALFGSDHARAVGQWAVGTVAWAFFAWEVGRNLVTRAARYLTVAVLLAFALLHDVAGWDFAILSESLSLSLGVVVLAALLRWLRTDSIGALALMTVVAVWWTFVRPDIRVFIVVVMGFLVLVAARVLWRWYRSPGRHAKVDPVRSGTRSLPAGSLRKVTAALASCLVLGLGMIWYSAISPNLDQTMTHYDGDEITPPLPQDEHRLVYRLRVDVSTNPELWNAFKTELGMPTCPELEAFTTQSDWQGAAWAEAYRRCPPLVAWVQQRKDQNFWTLLAEKDPVLFAKAFGRELSLTLGGEGYADVPHVLSPPVDKVAFPSRRYGLVVAVVELAVAGALVGWARAWRDHRRLGWLAVIVVSAGLLSAMANIALVTGELGRYGLRGSVAMRIGTIVLLGCALDAALARRRGNPGGEISSTAAATSGPAQAAA